MLKGLLLIAAAISVASAAALSRAVPDDTTECLYENQLWGGEDPRAIYFCNDGVVYQDACRTNYYFVRNATVTGCIPAAKMDPNCLNTLDTTVVCEGESLTQPQGSRNPGQFYLCPSENASPVLLSCPDGKGFLNVDGYLGCFEWSMWRQLRNCAA